MSLIRFVFQKIWYNLNISLWYTNCDNYDFSIFLTKLSVTFLVLSFAYPIGIALTY